LDISSDWTRVLTELRKLMEICKVPKTKVLEQEYIRTMFFEKLKENQLTVTFDGEEYSVSQAANVDIWSCRQHLAQEIWPKFDINDIEEQCTASNFKTFKADVFKVLRKWEGMYSKHQRFTNPEIAAIHQKVVQPLQDLFKSNYNFANLNDMITKSPLLVPEFRFLALEEKFIDHMTRVCELLRDYG
jgi:hypothetical protein